LGDGANFLQINQKKDKRENLCKKRAAIIDSHPVMEKDLHY
jgi:hypothetical protein